ncbi:MAG: class I SAM-dependent methyltransferase [Candidatus Eremiobacteraeota bacterium]|nr:class I SAM-dependent methyltransferase [Candidatus Eremiobacteraeota bacterium]
MSIRSKAFELLRTAAAVAGFDIRYTRVRDAANIPDGYLYRPLFEPWRSQAWKKRLRMEDDASLVTADRKYVLHTLLEQAARAVDGDVAECGVYRGGTAYLFAELLMRIAPQKRLYLFDTFEGMPETDARYDRHLKGDFSDTSLEAVRRYLRNFGNVEFRPGFIPQSFTGLEDRKFCFVHIDLDIYEAVTDASQYAYERLTPGGILVYDDYGFASCPGARRAVDEFFEGRLEVPLVLPTGQCIVFRI